MHKLWFIISGFHNENFPQFVKEMFNLTELNKNEMDIFWSCHKEPSNLVKELFPDKYQVFPNLGLEDGAYQQALDFLGNKIDQEDYIFFLHDDLTIKSFAFIKESIELIEIHGKKFIGNGMNYPAQVDLYKEIEIKNCKYPSDGDFKTSSIQLFFFLAKSERIGRLFNPNSYPTVKNEIEHTCIFNNVLTIRESFICTKKKYIDEVEQFEVIWAEPVPDENGKFHIGGMGNTQQTMLGFKICQLLGPNSIVYLSDTYQDSEYIYEHARGLKE